MGKFSKKVIIWLIVILSLVAVGRLLKVKGYIPSDIVYQTLVKFHILKPCFNGNNNLIEISSQEGFDYNKENEKAIKESLVKLKNLKDFEEQELKVPAITHRIYIVVENSSTKLNTFYIEEMKSNFNKLNELGIEWEHNLWSNEPEIFPEEVRNIKNVKIRNISELGKSELYEELLEIVKKGEGMKAHLAEAADLARLIIVEKFGGIYMDMDYEVFNPKELLKLMKNFDFLAGRETPAQNSLYGNAFFAAKANHPILVEALVKSHRNHDLDEDELPVYLKYPCKGYDLLYFSGPPLITISYFAKNNIDGNNDIILPSWMVFNVNFARYKNGIYHSENKLPKPDNFLLAKIKETFRLGVTKFSRKACNYSLIEAIDFQKNEENLEQLKENFINEITIDDYNKSFDLKNANREYLESEDNIFYNLKDKSKYPIIGADMFCGGWTGGGKVYKRKYYWNFD